MSTDTIRETVARALCRARKQPEEVRIIGAMPRVEPNWPRYLPDADAAIAAHLSALEAAGMVVVPRPAKSPAEIVACAQSGRSPCVSMAECLRDGCIEDRAAAAIRAGA